MFYVGCIIEGLSHLHERKIAHRCLGMSAKMLVVGEGGLKQKWRTKRSATTRNNKKKRRQQQQQQQNKQNKQHREHRERVISACER